MPRSNLIGNSKYDIALDQIRQAIHVTIVKAETEHNISRAQTIEMSGMSSAGFYKAWRDPSLFRVGQLFRVYEFLRVPEEERRYT